MKIALPTLLLFGVAALFGFVVGLGAYTFNHAEGLSYLSDDPAACVNCHVMRDQYESWQHSSHRPHAVCNDCHTPKGFAAKWTTKAVNGWLHSVAFTTGDFADPIFIKDFNLRIALENCVSCHEVTVSHMRHQPHRLEEIACTRCHGNVGHQANK
jgi:cytochrome c nitrite reductase small subunit